MKLTSTIVIAMATLMGSVAADSHGYCWCAVQKYAGEFQNDWTIWPKATKRACDKYVTSRPCKDCSVDGKLAPDWPGIKGLPCHSESRIIDGDSWNAACRAESKTAKLKGYCKN
ncbi:Hypothetical protein D9617_17g047620 [Elsinoe fawcettii]|nr:Hypothetical protein D9617_17g047620 [Elsinoe fawcettii]